MNNYFIENSINAPKRCGWVNCNNVSEPGSGRCEMHERADKNEKITKLNKLQRKVYDAIQRRPEAVNDDAILQAEVWQSEGWDESRSLEDNLRYHTRAETLSRRRRELFNLGLIEYSPKAMKTRTEAFKKERDKASPIPPQMRTIKSNMTTPEGERCVLERPHPSDECIFEPLEQASLL